MREREASLSDNKIAAAAASMGNRGTQLSDYVSDRKKAQSNKVFNVTGLTGALKGEKEGDLGVNLDNSKYVTTTSERNAQKIDQYFENRKAEKLRLAELEAQKKQIAETPENGDNNEGAVLALPSEQVDESHVAAQQSDASAEQDSQVIAEQTLPSEQTGENNVAAQQSEALEEQDSQVVADQAQTSEQADESHVMASVAQRAKVKANIAEKVKANIAENRKAIDSSRFGGEYAANERRIRNEAVLREHIRGILDGTIKRADGTSYRRKPPAKVSVAVNMKTGQIFVGYSGDEDNNPTIEYSDDNRKEKKLADKLKQRLDALQKEASENPTNEYRDDQSYDKYPIGNCAEVKAVNRALLADKNLEIKDIYINTRIVRGSESKGTKSGDYAHPCKNCVRIFHDAIFPKDDKEKRNLFHQTE